MKECYLFETLSRCAIQIPGFSSTSYNCDSKCILMNKKYYTARNFNPVTLSDQGIGGWKKHQLFVFSGGVDYTTNSKLVSMLHITHPINSDIVIAVIKKNSERKSKPGTIHYEVSCLTHKSSCASLNECLTIMKTKYSYDGRAINISDFKAHKEHTQSSVVTGDAQSSLEYVEPQ